MAYKAFNPHTPVPDAIVVKLYTSGDQIRGYVRKVTDTDDDDTIFPGEEMEPESAFRLAATHSVGEAPIYVDLSEGVEWNPAWGDLLR